MQEDNMRVANEWVKNIDDISLTSKATDYGGDR
jgi:hypothetical protein